MNNQQALMHDLQHEAPVVRLVDAMLHTAIAQSASDVHVEPTQKGLRIRFRIDGVMFDQPGYDMQLMERLIARLKILARIDIAEKRIAQDGQFRMLSGAREVDLRVSTFPSIWGQKVVIRILDRSKLLLNLDALGFMHEMKIKMQTLIARPQGFILVSGPTGSGKSTTLYAALSELNTPQKNIITLEDPVEYTLSGITQGQINADVGFSFSHGIRSLLRQDPDVVMVGEIRDALTAQSAHQAALTGHLVLSTIHTNDAPSAIMRLIDMQVEPFLINAALTGVLAQRLARKICLSCRIAVQPGEQEQLFLEGMGFPVNQVFQGAGCADCFGRGYKGRIGIFELLIMSKMLRSLIADGAGLDAIRQQACQEGMQSLLYDGAKKVANGLITSAELFRVVC